MRLIIIVTVPDHAYLLWQMAEKWPTDDVLNDTLVKQHEVDGDRIVVFCQFVSHAAKNRSRQIAERTTNWVINVANSPKYEIADEVYVAAHSVFVDFGAVAGQITNGRFRAGKSFHHESGSPNAGTLFDQLCDLISQRTRNVFDRALAAFSLTEIEEPNGPSEARRLADIVHELTGLFLPIAVDLQAWASFEFDDEYLEEIVTPDREDGLLERARELLYGVGETDSVEKLVKECLRENDPNWVNITRLLPRQEPQSNDEKENAAFYLEIYRTHDLLGALRARDKMLALKPILTTDNFFNRWCSQLGESLTALRNSVEADPDLSHHASGL